MQTFLNIITSFSVKPRQVSRTPISIIIASGIVGACSAAYVAYKLHQYSTTKLTIKTAEKIVDNDLGPTSDGLATEELEYPELFPEEGLEYTGPGLGAELDNSRMKTRAIRRVRRGRKTFYIAKLVCAAKCKFGTPVRSEANILVIRRFLNAQTKAHGLRESHARESVMIACELVFVYDQTELALIELRPYLQIRGYGYWHWLLSSVGLVKARSTIASVFADN